MGSGSPVVGPKDAAALRAFAAEPEPELATRDQVEVMIGKLAMATAQGKVSTDEADSRIDAYWLALKDLPAADLRVAFVEMIRQCKFLPTPAEARSFALHPGAMRRFAKSRARHLAWKHEREWRAPIDPVPPEEAAALFAQIVGGIAQAEAGDAA